MIGWGSWLLIPFQTFTSVSVFKIMIETFTEAQWGYIFLSLGLIRLITLIRDQAWEGITSIVLTTLVWSYTAVSFLISKPQALLAYVSGFLAVISLWETVRIIKKMGTRKSVKAIVKQI